MKVLLIQPRSDAVGFTGLILGEPLGLEMIAGALDRHEVKILDLRLRNDLHSALSSFKPDLCGISCSYTIDFHSTLKIAETIKKSIPGTFIVAGGHHPSLNYQDFALKEIDALVIGEGEETFKELVDALEKKRDLKKIPGLVLNQEGGQVITPPRPLQRNLDLLPFPLRNGLERNRYHLGFQRPGALVETSRGCTYQCSFCGVWQFYQRTYRSKTPERVVEELAKVREPFILFVDDNFLVDVQRAEKLAHLIRSEGIKKTYTFQARSDSIVKHPQIVKLWRDIGLRTVFVGFEKIEDEGLRALHKNNFVENNDRALKILEPLGIDVWAAFIVDPDYNLEDFRRLKDYILNRGIKTPTFSVLTPLPGTELFRELREKLTTKNYNLFDVAHAVLPTRLPLKEFYQEFCSLYQLPYSRYQLIREGIGAWLSRGFPLSHLFNMLRAAKKLSNPQCYLIAHGNLSNPRESYQREFV
ncbi:MAG: B12-binding domain-containing radical SAM protein [Thermodesulfobacteriota bacterium]